MNVVFLLLTLSSSLLSAVLWTGEVWDFLSFTERHPIIVYNILLFGLTSALGQVGGLILDGSFVLCMLNGDEFPETLHVQTTLFSEFLCTDLHLYDGGVLWASDLLHCHHDEEVLHHPRFCHSVWQCHEYDAVGRHHPGLPW